MPSLVLLTEEQAAVAALKQVAEREYRRGLEQGFAVVGDILIWLRSTKARSGKPAHKHEYIATMAETLIAKEREREGL